MEAHQQVWPPSHQEALAEKEEARQRQQHRETRQRQLDRETRPHHQGEEAEEAEEEQEEEEGRRAHLPTSTLTTTGWGTRTCPKTGRTWADRTVTSTRTS